MNKKILMAVILLLCIGIISIFAVKVFTPKEEIVYDQTNRVFVVKGDVKVKKAQEGSKWQDMDTSTVLEKGDVIETGDNSTVDIVLGIEVDKSVKVGEKSHIEFQQINPTQVKLPRGKILVALKKLEPKSSFIVKTPTAISGARGTAWMEEAASDRTRVCVFESQVFVQGVDLNGKGKGRKRTVGEGDQVTVPKGAPIGIAQKLSDSDIDSWARWGKSIQFLREGKILVDDFNRKENFNNLDGPFGSWNVFYSDPNQYCRDEFDQKERRGDSGYCIKIEYDVDSPFSAYNGFFTNLMGIDLTDYKYIVFYLKGDKAAGFTSRVKAEIKSVKEVNGKVVEQVGKRAVEGITDEWKKYVIPLKEFGGISDFKKMKEFVIVFADIEVSKKVGVIYIDDIYFTKEKPAEQD